MPITPFKVIQGHKCWYQSKAHVRLLLVINTNLLPILHRFRDIAFDRSKTAIKPKPSCLMPPPRWRSSLRHIIVSDISLKIKSFGLHFCCKKCGNIFNRFYAGRLDATDFAEMTQNNGHYTVQGHRFWYQSKAHMRLPIRPSD